jgi:hypothetical protein
MWFSRFVLGAVAAAAVTSSAFAGETMTSSKKMVTPPEEEESWWSAALTAGYDSKYIFRGVYLVNEDGKNIDNLIYTDLSFSAFGATLGAWYASSWDDDYNELDIYGSYTLSIGETGLDLTVGAIYYAFPDFEDTWEGFASIAYTGLAWVTPSLSYYYDFEVYEGSYVEFKLASSIPLISEGDDTVLSLDPYALISVGDYNTFGEDFDANNVQAGVALVWAMSENIKLSGYGAVSEPLDAIDDSQDTEFWGGGKITFSF